MALYMFYQSPGKTQQNTNFLHPRRNKTRWN